mmetsp:Transcript_56470/g.134100  ORF Transcript_56470/g.134100 Transcript_56470/m.134100 type:complete len:222 (-) Transcript_56470:203-868(-)
MRLSSSMPRLIPRPLRHHNLPPRERGGLFGSGGAQEVVGEGPDRVSRAVGDDVVPPVVDAPGFAPSVERRADVDARALERLHGVAVGRGAEPRARLVGRGGVQLRGGRVLCGLLPGPTIHRHARYRVFGILRQRIQGALLDLLGSGSCECKLRAHCRSAFPRRTAHPRCASPLLRMSATSPSMEDRLGVCGDRGESFPRPHHVQCFLPPARELFPGPGRRA